MPRSVFDGTFIRSALSLEFLILTFKVRTVHSLGTYLSSYLFPHLFTYLSTQDISSARNNTRELFRKVENFCISVTLRSL